ncbi:unnamed protein product, partial [Mesorhabditis belari]|uniref:7TM GPCR serpentine receptor class x (Srx) domain-containing protein n=1 Tax=Mesorhabditis belari TaxID=2138241 RepID=A0AAF3J7U2_9BILA
MVKKFGIPITVREQLRLNGVMNVSLFLHTELVLRPIAYEWLFPITALPPWFPRVLYATQVILKNNIYLIYIPSAINRFTAFYYPIKHQHIWGCARFRVLFFLVWTISTIFALPSILSDSAQFVRAHDNGPLDLIAFDQLIGETLSFLLSLTAVIVTTSLSIACLLKYRSMHFRVNRNLYECQLFLTSLTAYPPFLIYTIKSVLELVSSFTGNESMKQTYLITW